MTEIYNEFINNGILKENILLNEPMCKHTSFKIGGPANYYIKVFSIGELKKTLNVINKNNIPFFILGNGTNILVKDVGFRGVVIHINFNNIEINGTIATVGAGVKNAILSQELIKNELTGFEFASGIPGTIGGAIKMNAGAYGNEYKDIVQEVKYMDYDGNIYTSNNIECEFLYRSSRFCINKFIILQAKLLFKKDEKEKIEARTKEILNLRKEKQPLEYPNAGSTFKRGEDFITSQLIDECGLKGYSIGGAEVSTKHAGFIINKNNATANDVIELIKYVKTKVKEKTGKDIELEIEIIGG